MMTASKARYMIEVKSGTREGAYYSVGVEVPPRQGASFSMRYTTVPSAREGWRLLRQKMARKRVGMVGELVLFSADGMHAVSLGGYVRRREEFEPFDGDPHGTLDRRSVRYRGIVRGKAA